MKWAIALPAALLTCALLATAAQAQARYQRWDQGDQQQLRQALDELDRLVGEAERARAADPRFIQDLRGLSQKYRAQLQTGGAPQPAPPETGPYVVDTFEDGNFTSNPTWRVISGSFQVLADHRLISAVVLKEDDRAAAERDAGGSGRASDVVGILSQILLGNQGASQSQAEQPVQASQENAEIRVDVPITNAFVLDVDISSRTTQGAIEFAISQGDTVRPGYGLLYRTSEGLLLIRRGTTSNVTIAQASPRGSLFDGLEHNIRWERDAQGQMFVEIDGVRVLRVTDMTFKDPFDGLSYVNRGGVQLVHKIKVDRR